MVTKRGVETAVLVPAAEWHRIQQRSRPTLKQLLLSDRERGDLAIPARGARKRRVAKALSMFLLDTNIVSELRRALPHGAVLAWLEAQEDADLYLSAVTLCEILAGTEITRTHGPLLAAQIEPWSDALASE